jgi:hypothetical protein
MMIVENVKFGVITTNTNQPHLDLDIFRIDFDHAEKEMIGVGKLRFRGNYVQLLRNSVFQLLSKIQRNQQTHFSDYCALSPQTTAKLSASFMVIVASVKFGESKLNFCEIAFFNHHFKTPRHQQIHFSDYWSLSP